MTEWLEGPGLTGQRCGPRGPAVSWRSNRCSSRKQDLIPGQKAGLKDDSLQLGVEKKELSS